MGLDAVKGFAILIVMIGHCIGLNNLHDSYIYDAIAAVQMPLFMMISGYISGMKKKEGFRPDIKDTLSVIGRRSIKYLIPFFVWIIITHPTSFVKEIELQLFQLDRGLWFLMTLWIVAVVSQIADHISSKVDKWVWLYLVIIGVVYILFFLQERSGNTFLSPALTVRYMPFFVFGFLYGALKYENKNIRGSIVLVCTCIFVALVAAFEMVGTPDKPSLLIQMTASFVGTVAIFLAVRYYTGGIVQKGLAFIGGYTLEIYVIHFRFARVLNIVDKGIMPLTKDALMWVTAAFIVMSICTALIIFLVKMVPIADLLLFGNIKKRNKNATSAG